jgi:hypothetical protein
LIGHGHDDVAVVDVLVIIVVFAVDDNDANEGASVVCIWVAG